MNGCLSLRYIQQRHTFFRGHLCIYVRSIESRIRVTTVPPFRWRTTAQRVPNQLVYREILGNGQYKMSQQVVSARGSIELFLKLVCFLVFGHKTIALLPAGEFYLHQCG